MTNKYAEALKQYHDEHEPMPPEWFEVAEQALQAQAESQWQPIETAPKEADGEPILLMTADGPRVASWWLSQWCFDFTGCGEPTLWMPLDVIPEPPEEENDQNNG